jgi:hypothetical protein
LAYYYNETVGNKSAEDYAAFALKAQPDATELSE